MDKVTAMESLVEDYLYRERIVMDAFSRVRRDPEVALEDKLKIHHSIRNLSTTLRIGELNCVSRFRGSDAANPFITQITTVLRRRMGVGSRISYSTFISAIERYMPSVLYPAATMANENDQRVDEAFIETLKEEVINRGIGWIDISER